MKLPIRSGEDKISPTSALSLPFENPTIGDASVRTSSIAIENKALRANGSGDMEYAGGVEPVLGSRN